MEKENNKDIEQIGKFGVGFYSGFMVAKKIEVLSKKLAQMKVGSGALKVKESLILKG